MGHSYLLFARPSFLGGIARLLDFGGTLKVYNESRNGEEADNLAFLQDWKAIVGDLREAVVQYKTLHNING
jgi:hypothetical protein